MYFEPNDFRMKYSQIMQPGPEEFDVKTVTVSENLDEHMEDMESADGGQDAA